MNLFVFKTLKKVFHPLPNVEYSVFQRAVGLPSRCTHNLYSIRVLNTPSSSWYQCLITFPHTIIVKSPYNGMSMREGGVCPLFHLVRWHWSWENSAVIIELLRTNGFITWRELVPQYERKQCVSYVYRCYTVILQHPSMLSNGEALQKCKNWRWSI